MSVSQVLTETSNGDTTIYEYGLERIAAYTEDSEKTQYVHDAGGSVISTLSYEISEDLKTSASAPKVTNYSYNPFGEQLGTPVSGYTYNAEYYDSATGMIDLRARHYEPLTMRFSQKDILRGSESDPVSLNRYLYCHNNPLSFSDPTGMSIFSKLTSAVKSTTKAIKSTAKTIASKTVSSSAKVTTSVAKTVSKVSTAVTKASNTVTKTATEVTANSNCKLIKSLKKTENKDDRAVSKVTEISKKITEISAKIAETYKKTSANSLSIAKSNFSSLLKTFKDTINTLKQKVACSVKGVTGKNGATKNGNNSRNSIYTINGLRSYRNISSDYEVTRPPKLTYESESDQGEQLIESVGDYNGDGKINSKDISSFEEDAMLKISIYGGIGVGVAGLVPGLIVGGWVGAVFSGVSAILIDAIIGYTGHKEGQNYKEIIEEMEDQEEVQLDLEYYYSVYSYLDPNSETYESQIHYLIAEIKSWKDHKMEGANSEQIAYAESLLSELESINNSLSSDAT